MLNNWRNQREEELEQYRWEEEKGQSESSGVIGGIAGVSVDEKIALSEISWNAIMLHHHFIRCFTLYLCNR